MSKYFIRLNCHEKGCGESSFYSYDTKRDYNEAIKRRAGKDWMCVRHSDDRLLTLNKLTSNTQITSVEGEAGKRYWDSRSGFTYGHGWKAFAEDFPVGTIIVESVQIILPQQTEASNDTP